MEKSKSYSNIFQNRSNSKHHKKSESFNPKIERWDQLYSLNKVILQKKEILKKESEAKKKEAEIEGCTFNPFCNSGKTIKNDNLNVLDRYSHWNTKKTTKIEKLRKEEEEAAVKECNFKPVIHDNLIKNNRKSAEKVVKNSDSYNTFIKRTKLIREDKIKKEKKIQLTPGSGKIWKNAITVPKNIILLTDKKNPRSTNVSLSRSHSASTIKNNKDKITGLERNIIPVTSFSEQSVLKLVEDSQLKGIQIKEPMNFNCAVGYLHGILHNINL